MGIKELREKNKMTQLQLAEKLGVSDDNHKIRIERIEDEYYVRIEHDMTKNHYISFIAAQSSDRLQMVKLYPEQSAEARFKLSGVKRILCYCNRDGFYSTKMGIRMM